MSVAVVLALVLGATGASVFMADGTLAPGVAPAPADNSLAVSEVIALRFSDNFGLTRPDPSKAERNPLAPLLSATDFQAAIAAVDANARVRYANPDGVFNEAQIASIKTRLKLTSDQEQHWRPLEDALRAVSWIKSRGARGPVLEGASVQRLKEAATNLAALLRADQKREVRLLAHVVGLKVDDL